MNVTQIPQVLPDGETVIKSNDSFSRLYGNSQISKTTRPTSKTNIGIQTVCQYCLKYKGKIADGQNNLA